MSNLNKDQPSIRVFAPPGGRSANIFGVPEPEQPISIKKNHMQSDIFGCKKDNNDSAPVKPTRVMTNNIFGSEPDQPALKSKVYSEKNRSTIFDEAPPQQPSNKPDRQRSNIFGSNEPTQSGPARPYSEKHRSNIFGIGDNDEQNKRQTGTRQGLRVGYNPINGESYTTKDGLNSKVESSETSDNEKPSEGENEEQTKNGHEQSEQNGHTQETTENENGHASVDKPANGHTQGTNGNNVAKNSHANGRAIHPPGGKSNGPLW